MDTNTITTMEVEMINRDGVPFGRIYKKILTLKSRIGDINRICANTILEHGNKFNWVWLSNLETGGIHCMDTADLIKQPCDDDGYLLVKCDDFRVIGPDEIQEQFDDF